MGSLKNKFFNPRTEIVEASNFKLEAWPERKAENMAKEGYEGNAIVYRCVEAIASGFANATLKVYKDDGNGVPEEQPKHPALKILDGEIGQPISLLLKQMAISHRVYGEIILRRLPEDGTPNTIVCMDPSKIKVEHTAAAVSYQFIGSEKKPTWTNSRFDDKKKPILHIKTVNPSNPERGLSPLRAAAKEVDTHNAGIQWNYSLLKNSAKPSGVFTIKNGNENERKTFVEKMTKFMSGVLNAGKSIITSGELDYHQLSLSPKDMDFVKTIGNAMTNIALVYNVPLPLISNEASTFNNMQSAQEQLWEDNIIPLLNEIIPQLSDWLMGLLGDTEAYIGFDVNHVPALQNKLERRRKAELELVKAGIKTPDEARIALGLDSYGGAAQFLMMPSNNVPIDVLTSVNATDEAERRELTAHLKKQGMTDAQIKSILDGTSKESD